MFHSKTYIIKNYVFLGLLLFYFQHIIAQTPYLPANYTTLPTTHNLVRSYTVLQPGLTPIQITNTNADPRVVQLTTAYFDGLGRPIQAVVRQGSLNTANGESTPKDLVQLNTYDAFGREAHQFLPFVSSETNGNFKGGTTTPTNPFQMQKVFYDNSNVNLNPIAEQGESYYYSQTDFEPSPLNRPEKTMAPGNNWVGAGRGVEQGYFFNTFLDSVRIWNVTNATTLGNWGSYATPAGNAGIYPAGRLYKTITKDEHGKQVIEYKDKQGQVILKKVQLTAAIDNGSGSGYDGWICTYYIYDDFGNLRCVVQPEGVRWLTVNSWVLTNTTVLAERCFRYEYDGRRRMIIKKVPGAGEVSMVYDARDRLVFTQDASRMAVREWIYTWYDGLNRPDTTGIVRLTTESGTAAARRNAMATLMQDKIHSFYPPGNVTSNTILTITHYDDYSKLGNYTGHGLTATVEAVDGFSGENNTVYPYARALPVSPGPTRGMPTITRTRIIGTSNFITSLTIFDSDGRAIQTKTYNPEGQVTDIITTQYGFAGQVMRTLHSQRVAQTNPQTLITVTEFEFDGIGRPSKTKKQLGHVYGASQSPALSVVKTIAEVRYDALGQVRDKLIGTKPGTGNPLETIKYDYNIRGWLLGVNRAFVTTANTGVPVAGKWFGFDLGYDKSTNASGKGYDAVQYNGNISGQSWRSAGDNVARQYQYTYDAANRLMKGNFEQNQGSGWAKSFNYDSWMGDGNVNNPNSAYDLNGNIRKMQQWGWTASNTGTKIDDLTYSYYTVSNKLSAVNDAAAIQTGLGDFTNKVSVASEYGYDSNGNMVTDLNKRLNGTAGNLVTSGGAITYNHLNLPVQITVKNEAGTANKGTIVYTYAANGTKLRKVVTEPGATVNGTSTTITTTTFYLGSIVYETKAYSNSTLQSTLGYSYQLQFFGHEEGRVRAVRPAPKNNLTALVYDYMLKDHLGNVRMVLTEEQTVDDYPTVTMEDVYEASESLYYTGVNSLTRANRHPGMPADGSTSPNNRAALLSNTGQRIGPGILLKVQAGDEVELWCRSWWTGSMGGQTNSNPTGIRDAVATLLGQWMPGTSGGKITGAQAGTNGSFFAPAILSFLQGNNPEQASKPKAYINWLFLDEQFNYQTGNGSGADPVGAANLYPLHERSKNLSNPLQVRKSGYLYIYTSNESSLSVYFDNLKVKHHRGALLEETHYYPFGLTMAGISSKAAGKLENRKKFNGIEHTTELDLNTYDAFFRNADPQIGRFWQIDPETEMLEEYSPYESMGNNPICNVDPLGDFKTRFGAWLHKVFNGGGTVGENKYGEFYVQKVSTTEDGSATVSLTYGKGRDKYSNVREALVRDAEIQADIFIKGEKSMYQMYDSPQEAGKAALGIGTGLLLPNPILKQGTIAANAAKGKPPISSSQNLKSLSFTELQSLVKKSSDAMNSYFKSKGKTVPTKEQLEAYKELSERIIQGTGGAPAAKASAKAVEVQTQRIEMINQTLKLMQ